MRIIVITRSTRISSVDGTVKNVPCVTRDDLTDEESTIGLSVLHGDVRCINLLEG